ncbi:MBL fold metallo-hydrolase [Halalkalibacter nanhaiisediminis]|uniref:Glyoxylase-like metal-dependent hydrolase (Beta-lactamase superfamily II) n=1 Tax=Halalkalibacter nanhaiisediminis TaxID=688079 RepID=A0A562QBK8_9BACI|nr:MBL fold metallo-hydrolase [Halalkalibacter nanhaiisediminis]TWI54093.1 glyoxylase-like metal-dependent hydrolase (beta-lactamase superfamily II) [Halalkalibacter nanhaiisediminis]
MTIQAMKAGELAKVVINKEELFILDVRNTDQFDEWKVEGEGIEMMNKPYFDLIEGVDEIVDQIPHDKDILVVCAKEGSSKFVAEMLSEAKGQDIYYLEGGMKAWSEHLEPIKVGDLDGGGAVYQFVRLGKGCLSYLIVSDDEGAMIDPLRLVSQYKDFADALGIKVLHMFDTHLHADHISGGRRLAESTGGTYYLPPKDAGEVTFKYETLEDGKEVTFGEANVRVKAVYTPGHTIGSTSLIVNDTYLFTGDILFIDSIGRPDLAGKAEDWVSDLRESLYVRYKALDQELLVLPAHFAKLKELDEQGRVFARLGDLYKTNEGLMVEDEEEFRRMVSENLPPQPNSYQEIRQTNMGKLSPSPEEETEMEIGPNRCAVS